MEPVARLIIPAEGLQFVSMNQLRTAHWTKKHKLSKQWRERTWAACAQARFPRGLEPARIVSQLMFTSNRRRDPHNYMATLKPIIDELMSWGCWPDDTAEFVRVDEPVLAVGKAQQVTLLIFPQEKTYEF